jgi:hypothetical protein
VRAVEIGEIVVELGTAYPGTVRAPAQKQATAGSLIAAIPWQRVAGGRR